MGDLIKKDQNGLVDIITNNEKRFDLPKPFEHDIFLFVSYVAGTTHIENIGEIYENLEEGEKLNLYREPDNEHDPQAISIETSRKEKIGYVPRQDNVIFSRLMDAGKNLFAKVEDKEMRGKWARIKINIYLRES
ncbi:HIRAN domain [Anaerococcus prevotii]|uniref:HIRAN n=1 Tax=Anaerococcus prevotii (strain ATCC 9321 / DSM 20548 / JCM 6508 / NCTC 11806 / PC1) TaxID=525919 RepID=C7RH02_ANAPD|nr:HIRAN domain-containing protein [Anaerococcus prevotii]ACV28763.1 HIRAN [Anaerococcus prevotii DSM 20548]SUU94438.1 HIRAN domain [Anaerococcus prevotii]